MTRGEPEQEGTNNHGDNRVHATHRAHRATDPFPVGSWEQMDQVSLMAELNSPIHVQKCPKVHPWKMSIPIRCDSLKEHVKIIPLTNNV